MVYNANLNYLGYRYLIDIFLETTLKAVPVLLVNLVELLLVFLQNLETLHQENVQIMIIPFMVSL